MADADAAREVFARCGRGSPRRRRKCSPKRTASRVRAIGRCATCSDELAEEHPRSGVAPDDTELTRGFVKRPADIGDAVVPAPHPVRVPPEESARLIASSAASSGIEAFEERPEQVQMARRSPRRIAGGDQLIVEAGTGVGKSLAYLLPAALHAARNGARTVISTNTINLQDQLAFSDIPLARRILAAAGLTFDDLRVAQLKGRGNYLCLLRWAAARHAAVRTADEAQVLVRMLFWLAEPIPATARN